MKNLSVICAGLLLLASAVADSHAQERQTRYTQPLPSDRSFRVSDFSAESDVVAFSIEGVSLETPFDDIRDILTQRGYEEEFLTGRRLKFFKGGSSRGSGQVTYQIEIDDSGGGRYLRFMRATTDGPISATDSALWSEQPLPSSEDVEKLKSLKSTICNGIPDARERWQLCPPNVDDDARLTIGRFGVTLVEGLIIEVLTATPLATVIQIRRRP